MAWMQPTPVDDDDRIGAAEATRVIRRAAAMVRPYRGEVILGVVCMVAWVACSLAGPALVRWGIDSGLGGDRGIGAGDGRVLNVAAVAFVAVALGGLVLGRAQLFVVTRVGEKFLRDLRVRVFDHLMGMSLGFYDREQTGRLVGRMTSDIDSLSELVQQGLVMFVVNALLFALSVVVLLSLSPVLALACLVAVPVVVVASIRFRRESNRAYLLVRDRISQTLSTLQEGLAGVRVIQAFAQEDVQVRRFARHNHAQLDANLEATRLSAWYFPVIEVAGIGTTAVVVGFGGWLVHRGDVTVGTVAAFVLYLANLFEPVQQLSQLFNVLQSAGASLSKLFGLLDTRSPIVERPGAIDLPERGALDVAEVSFAYGAESAAVLTDVTLRVEPGERLALVGPTGAGKSTLAKLVARFYDPTAGRVAFGGVDLRDATLASLRRRIVVVPQEGHLFAGSILDNVRIGRPTASDDEVASAMRRIGVHDRFAALPEGLHAEVREGGSRLSAGERQLVSLARAALTDPAVLVLDEATSNLDPGTEADVEAALEALVAGRTVIVIAHRLSTAERSDRIAVVDAGGLSEVGSHAELLAARGRYADLYRSWTGSLSTPAADVARGGAAT